MSIHQELATLIAEMRSEISGDVADGTLIPTRYQQVKQQIDHAERELQAGAVEKALHLLGAINIDSLHQVDVYDDLITDLLRKVYALQTLCKKQQVQLPEEISLLLTSLHTKIDECLALLDGENSFL